MVTRTPRRKGEKRTTATKRNLSRADIRRRKDVIRWVVTFLRNNPPGPEGVSLTELSAQMPPEINPHTTYFRNFRLRPALERAGIRIRNESITKSRKKTIKPPTMTQTVAAILANSPKINPLIMKKKLEKKGFYPTIGGVQRAMTKARNIQLQKSNGRRLII